MGSCISNRGDVKNFGKRFSFELDQLIYGILELSDSTIACWTATDIKIFKIKENSLELANRYPCKIESLAHPIENEGNIIYVNSNNEFTILDKHFNILEQIKESYEIFSICKISLISFAVGLSNGTVKKYSRNNFTKKYEVVKEYNQDSKGIRSLLYNYIQNCLISGSNDNIKIIYLNDIEKPIRTLPDQSEYVSSLITLNDKTFASGNTDGQIKIWSTKENSNFELLKSIQAHEKNGNPLILNLLENDYMISIINDKLFKIWDLETFECLKTFQEDSVILGLMVTKNQNIITTTQDKKINLWKILE